MSEQPQPPEEINTLDPSSVIIIHPGSLYLRVGRASDPNPKKMLHAIARRRKIEKFKHSDPLIVNKNPDVNLGLVENCRQKLIQQLQKSIRSDGRKRVVPPGKKIAELNASQKPHIVSDHLEESWYVFEEFFLISLIDLLSEKAHCFQIRKSICNNLQCF